MSSNKTKINVMHTVLSLEVGGLEKVVCDLVSGFDRERFNVEVCCFDTIGELAKDLNECDINVTLVQRNTNRYDVFFPFRLSKFLRKKNVHLLHMHSGTFFLGAQAGILARKPAMIYTDHGRHLIEPKFLFFMDRFSSIFSDKIIAVSKELEDYLVNVVKLPRRKTTTIINGIDTVKYSPRCKPSHLLKEFGIAENTKVIGTVGRLAEVKDQKSMIEAFSLVNRKFPNSILILVGDGPKRSDLQQSVKESGVNNSVIFAGNRSDVQDLLNIFDVFLLTSLSEGTSVSLLEAMASGIPPVVTNVGGNPSIVNNGINGFLVEPKDISHIANSIIQLLEDEVTSKSISHNVVNTVINNYSLGKMIEQYTLIYNELCR